MIRKSVLLAALVTLAPAALLAADPAATTPPAGKPHGEGRWFAQVDTNHDGAISREEALAAAQARIDKQFAQLDTNHDGLITQDDLPSYHATDAGKEAVAHLVAPLRTLLDDEIARGAAPAVRTGHVIANLLEDEAES